ncbi:MAG TPA: hypothetical protein VN832_06710 [Stellaceae bacterium]|nr:hypothetical protein [Stellaceae bacterium]
MPSFPERLPEPSLSGERPEPNLAAGTGRASARLLRPRREAAPQPASRSAEPAQELPPRLSLNPGDRMVVPSSFAAAKDAGGTHEALRRQAVTGVVVALALFGAFSLGRLLLELLSPGGFHLG